MAALTDITLSDKSGGTAICKAAKGTLTDASGEVKLAGATWQNLAAKDALKFLQKKVALTAKLARTGQPVKSYAKMMYIIGITGANEVRLADKASD